MLILHFNDQVRDGRMRVREKNQLGQTEKKQLWNMRIGKKKKKKKRKKKNKEKKETNDICKQQLKPAGNIRNVIRKF